MPLSPAAGFFGPLCSLFYDFVSLLQPSPFLFTLQPGFERSSLISTCLLAAHYYQPLFLHSYVQALAFCCFLITNSSLLPHSSPRFPLQIFQYLFFRITSFFSFFFTKFSVSYASLCLICYNLLYWFLFKPVSHCLSLLSCLPSISLT